MHQLFFCDCCGKSFKNVDDCRDHERTHYKVENLKVRDIFFSDYSTFSLPCEIRVCDYVNKRQGYYKLSLESEYTEEEDKE